MAPGLINNIFAGWFCLIVVFAIISTSSLPSASCFSSVPPLGGHRITGTAAKALSASISSSSSSSSSRRRSSSCGGCFSDRIQAATAATARTRRRLLLSSSSASSSSSSSAHSGIDTAIMTDTAGMTGQQEVLPPSSMSSPSSTRSTLGGVVFDMDGTLTVPNIDFDAMYKECNVDPYEGDILAKVATYDPDEQTRCYAVIERYEEQGRQTMRLMQGASTILSWLSNHSIPVALVTRNTHRTVSVFLEKLMMMDTVTRSSSGSPSDDEDGTAFFTHMISRDDLYPPKPDPTALYVIATDWATMWDGGVGGVSDSATGSSSSSTSSSSYSILMVGDSVSNDVAFGNNAGVDTALLLVEEQDGGNNGRSDGAEQVHDGHRPDVTLSDLTELPRLLWQRYHIGGPLGTNVMNLHGRPSPQPFSAMSRLVVVVAGASGITNDDDGDSDWENEYDDEGTARIREALSTMSLRDIIRPDDADGSDDEDDDATGRSCSNGHSNTALIWAAEVGNLPAVLLLLDAVRQRSEYATKSVDIDDDDDDDAGLTSATSSSPSPLWSHLHHRGYLGATALCRAARRGHVGIVEALLSAEVEEEKEQERCNRRPPQQQQQRRRLPRLADVPNVKMQYPLHFAAFKQHPDVVRALLQSGNADPYVVDRKGRTPSQDTSCETIRTVLEKAMRERHGRTTDGGGDGDESLERGRQQYHTHRVEER